MISEISSTTQQAATTDARATTLSSDFDTFLKMLTAQLQNQDPLNPVDAEDFAVQLATFSSVEQQVLTNDLLKDLSSQIGTSAFADYGRFIGQSVLAKGAIAFDNSPVDLQFSIPSGATSAALTITAQDGTVVTETEIDPTDTRMTWAGVDDTGAPAAAGSYQADIAVFEDGVQSATVPVASFKTVDEIRLVEGEARLYLSTGEDLDPADMLGLKS